jgi:hypothetical protein
MMETLLARGEAVGARAQRQLVQRTAQKLRSMFGSGAVIADGTQVRVSGRDVLKRWLVDPAVRFLGGGMK